MTPALLLVVAVYLLAPPLVAVDGVEPRASFEVATYAGHELAACRGHAAAWAKHLPGARVRCILREKQPGE